MWTDLELLEELVDTANLLGYTVYPMDQQAGANSMLWSNFRYMARDTGGKAFMAGSNVKALDKVAFDTANYYWLGFVPDYQRDNRAHDIRVELREPRLRARYRRGYVDLSGRVEADGRFPAVPYDGAFRQQLELRFVALDRFRSRWEIPPVALSLGGGHEPAPDEVVVFQASLTLRRRPYELVVTVHDPVSRLTARGRVAVGGVQR